MFKKKRKIGFHKCGSGSINCKLLLPKEWLLELDIDRENPEVVIEFKKDKIIIKKYDEDRDYFL